MSINVLRVLQSVTQRLFYSSSRYWNPIMVCLQEQRWAPWWGRRSEMYILQNDLVSLRTKTSSCLGQLLLGAFEFMTLQQGRSVHRGGAVEAGTIYNSFNAFGNWVIVPRTRGRRKWLTEGIKPQFRGEFHLCKLQWLIQTMKYFSVSETIYSGKFMGLLYLT